MAIQFEYRLNQLEKAKREIKQAAPLEPDILTFATQILRAIHGESATLDQWQRELLESKDDQRVILNCSRQSGKSFIVALMALHAALMTPRSLSLVISPTLRQSKLLFDRILSMNDAAGRPIPFTKQTTNEIRLRNGASILALPGANPDSIRGYSSVDILCVDEAARVSTELINAILPFLAVSSSGRLIMLSTPRGYNNIFSEIFHTDNTWRKYKITALECSRISKEFLDEQRATMTPQAFAAEYMCTFNEWETAIFQEDAIQALLADDVAEWSL